eukprot:scaffold9726_cov119-Isochrysis_galbana.AAC.16
MSHFPPVPAQPNEREAAAAAAVRGERPDAAGRAGAGCRRAGRRPAASRPADPKARKPWRLSTTRSHPHEEGRWFQSLRIPGQAGWPRRSSSRHELIDGGQQQPDLAQTHLRSARPVPLSGGIRPLAGGRLCGRSLECKGACRPVEFGHLGDGLALRTSQEGGVAGEARHRPCRAGERQPQLRVLARRAPSRACNVLALRRAGAVDPPGTLAARLHPRIRATCGCARRIGRWTRRLWQKSLALAGRLWLQRRGRRRPCSGRLLDRRTNFGRARRQQRQRPGRALRRPRHP